MPKRIISLALAGALALGGLAACGAPAATTDASVAQAATTDSGAATSAVSSGTSHTAAEVLAENSAPAARTAGDADTSGAVAITLSGATITAGAGVTVDGGAATITAAGTYRVSGTLDDGQIVVDTDDEAPVYLILDGAAITSATSAPLYVKEAAAVEVILADGSVNTLADAATYVYASADEDEPNAALFSDDALTISGDGALTVTASSNDGIASKDGLTISGGTITVSAPDDGIRGKDYLVVAGGAVTVNAGGDGLKADNADDAALGYVAISGGTLRVTAAGDGISAASDLVATGGDVAIAAGGGSGAALAADLSAKGLKATASITLDGGTFDISAADDGVHADGEITINGGALTIATGDDGVHAETSVTVNGGDIAVTGSVEGLEGAAIVLNDGAVSIVASDDGVNGAEATAASGTTAAPVPGGRGPGGPMGGGNATLAINGGTLVVDAAGDGIDVNGSITMTGGLVIVNGPTERMNGAMDYDSGFTVSGGTLVAVGSAGMAVAPSETSSQNALLLNFSAVQEGGTLVHIQRSAGEEVLTFAPSKPYQSLLFSSPSLTSGETYRVFLGGSVAGSESDGLYAGAGYMPGTEYTSFTVSGVVTQLGAGGGRFR